MKPNTWRDCHILFLERLLWDCELDYEPYESSKESTIHGILCGTISSINEKIVSTAFHIMSEEDYAHRVKVLCDYLEQSLVALRRTIDKP